MQRAPATACAWRADTPAKLEPSTAAVPLRSKLNRMSFDGLRYIQEVPNLSPMQLQRESSHQGMFVIRAFFFARGYTLMCAEM